MFCFGDPPLIHLYSIFFLSRSSVDSDKLLLLAEAVKSRCGSTTRIDVLQAFKQATLATPTSDRQLYYEGRATLLKFAVNPPASSGCGPSPSSMTVLACGWAGMEVCSKFPTLIFPFFPYRRHIYIHLSAHYHSHQSSRKLLY